MRNSILKTTTVIIAFIALTAFATSVLDGNANARRIQGVYVYVYSEPVQDYDVIYSKKITMTWSGQPKEMLDKTLKKLRKKEALKDADGVIFNENMDRYEVIKFK